jgi:hypothetical protein
VTTTNEARTPARPTKRELQDALCVLANAMTHDGCAGAEWSIEHVDGRKLVVFGLMDRPVMVERIHALFLDAVKEKHSYAERVEDSNGAVTVIAEDDELEGASS